MDSTVARYRTQERRRMPTVSPIFHARDVLGRHHIRGNARGPTERTAMMMKVVRKYQGSFSPARRGFLEASRNSPQCLHFMAASWISSAQKGQVFIFGSFEMLIVSPGDSNNECLPFYRTKPRKFQESRKPKTLASSEDAKSRRRSKSQIWLHATPRRRKEIKVCKHQKTFILTQSREVAKRIEFMTTTKSGFDRFLTSRRCVVA
jgi:hypothetical protein